MNKGLAFYTSLGPIMTKEGQSPGEETHANGTSVGRASFIKKKKKRAGGGVYFLPRISTRPLFLCRPCPFGLPSLLGRLLSRFLCLASPCMSALVDFIVTKFSSL